MSNRKRKGASGSRRRQLLQDKTADAFVSRNSCGLILSHGIGNHILVLALARAFEKQHGLKIDLIAGNPRYAFLRELFPVARRYIGWMAKPDDWRFANVIKKHQVYYSHFPAMQLARVIGYRGMTLLDVYKCRLGLPSTAPLDMPSKPSEQATSAGQDFLETHKCQPGKTVVLATKSRSLQSDYLPDSFWADLTERLKQNGFDVLFNDDPELSDKLGCPKVDLPLEQWRGTIAAAGHLIAVRSGLNELAANTGVAHSVIYPARRFFAGSVIEGTSIADYPTADSVMEIEFDPERSGVAETIDRLVGHHIAAAERRSD